MRPNTEPVGDPGSNGVVAVPGVTSDETNGHLNGGQSTELNELLHALQAMRVGDFSVRMAGNQIGLMGKIADTFNEIVAGNERMAQQLERVGHVAGREAKSRPGVKFGLSHGAWGEMETSVNTLIDD